MVRGAETKRKKNLSRGTDPLATNLERSPITGNSWRQVHLNKKVGAKENRQKGQRVSTGPLTWDQRGSIDVEPMVDNVRAHHGSNSPNAPILSIWGY